MPDSILVFKLVSASFALADSLFKSVVKLTVVELILSFNLFSSYLALATSEVILDVLPFTFSVRILILFVLSPVLLILLVNSAVIELIADFAAVESGFSKSLVLSTLSILDIRIIVLIDF